MAESRDCVTPAVVEVPAKDAHVRGIGTDHLAHLEGICVRQPVQYGAGHQARGSILLSAEACTSEVAGGVADRRSATAMSMSLKGPRFSSKPALSNLATGELFVFLAIAPIRLERQVF